MRVALKLREEWLSVPKSIPAHYICPTYKFFRRRTLLTLDKDLRIPGRGAAPERENLMENVRTNESGCTPLTSKILTKHTLPREHIPCSFLESPVPIFYNENVEISKGGGVR